MPAPYSDNLYSADLTDDSDAASDNDIDTHLSPTDGYFHASDPSLSALYPPQQESSSQSQRPQFAQPTSAGVPHVPNVLVADPSLAGRDEEGSKAREAREERINSERTVASSPLPSLATATATATDAVVAVEDQSWGGSVATPSHTRSASTSSAQASYTSYSPSTSTPLRSPRTHQQRSLFSERSPLFRVPAEAPPAYTPSPTSPTTSSPDRSENYQTFAPAAMGVPEESTRLLGHEPESMGGRPYDEESGFVPVWKNRVRKRVAGWGSRKTVKGVLWVALLLSIGIAIFVTITNVVVEIKKPHTPSAPKEPVTTPPGNTPPENAPPNKAPPSSDGPILPVPWNPSASCLDSEYRFPHEAYPLEFSPGRSLSLMQKVAHDDRQSGWQPNVYGDIVVRRQQNNSPAPSIDIEIISNDESLKPSISWNSDSQSLLIETPSRIDWSASAKPCIKIRATIWVPEKADMEFVELQSLHLDVKLMENLSINLSQHLDISTIVGRVQGASSNTDLMADATSKGDSGVTIDGTPPEGFHLNCREISITTISGDIQGYWPLYDSLKVASDSGAAIIAVGPKPVHEKNPKPAYLSVGTISGDVQVREPIEKALGREKPETLIPPRDYIIDITSASGNIKAELAFTSAAELSSLSGDMYLTLLPIFNVSMIQDIKRSELSTDTKSGGTEIAILEPLWVSITESDSQLSEPWKPEPPKDIPYIPIGNDDPYKLIPRPPRRPNTPTASYESGIAGGQLALRCLKSSHSTISGNMKLAYPASWEGLAHASSLSGDIVMIGKDLVITRRSNSYPKSWEARKGKAFGGSELHLDGISGNERLTVGHAK